MQLHDLEPRVLYSATPLDLAAIAGTDDASITVAEVDQQEDSQFSDESATASVVVRSELVVVDSGVPELQQVLDDLSESGYSNVVILDADRDGVEQISELLAGQDDLDALHIISHGNDGQVRLGNTWLSGSSLDGHAGQIALWNDAFASNADILFYGCDLASNPSGLDLVSSLSALTGTDVAASTDKTGHETLGADWNLEHATGVIETKIVVSDSFQDQWIHRLASNEITVTTDLDIDDSGDSEMSLREAIMLANSDSMLDTIILQANTTYQLTISGDEDNALEGDLDITSDITILGADAETTIIEGTNSGVFEVRSGGSLTISDLTVTGGDAAKGGGIHVQSNSGVLELTRVIVTNNQADNGAGIYNNGTITLTDVVISNNGTIGSTAEGGGIHNKGTATLTNVTLSGNNADDGGGIHQDNSASLLTITNSTISGNEADQKGGGIYAQANLAINHVTITNNTANNAGGINSGGGTVDIKNTIVAGNHGTAMADVEGSFNSLGNNLIGDTNGSSGFIGTDILDVSAGLSALQDSQGFGQVHDLVAGSQAIDAGATGLTTDQAGQTRDAMPDIGAVERVTYALQTSNEFVVSSQSGPLDTSSKSQASKQSIAMASDGSYVVVWTADGQDGSGLGVYARRFDGLGNALTNEIRVAETTNDNQKWASVASDTSGNFVVTWTSENQDSTAESVYARRFNANGSAADDEFRVNQTNTGNQRDSAIALDQSTGEFIVVWEGEGPGDAQGIFFRRFNSDGSAIDNNDLPGDASADNSHTPGVAYQSGGNFVIVHQEATDVHITRYNDTGAATATDRVDAGLVASWRPSVATDGADRVYVVHESLSLGVNEISIAIYNSNLSSVTPGALTNTGSGRLASVTATSSGDALVTWEQPNDSDGYSVEGIWITDPSPVGFQINQVESGDQRFVSAAALDRNNYVVAWTGVGNDGQTDAVARQFGSTPNPTNDAPFTRSDEIISSGDVTASVNVLTNDIDPEGSSLTVLDVGEGANGTITNHYDGTVSYDPNAPGSETFHYRVTDGDGGLTHYWGFAGDTQDSVGSAHGTNNGATAQNGTFGSGLQFDETTSHVEVSDFSYNSEFTVSFDFMLDDLSGSEYQYIYSHGTVGSSNSLNIYAAESGASDDPFTLKTAFRDANGTSSYNSLNTDISTLANGQWHNYTLTVNAADGAIVYLNGLEVARNANEGNNSFNPSGNLFLGAREDLNSARYFGGGLDTVQVFDRALSDSEVTDLLSAANVSTESVDVTINNQIPVITLSSTASIDEGTDLALSAAATDGDGDSMTYEWDVDYDPLGTFTADETTGSTSLNLTWAQLQTYGIDDQGSWDIALRVTDTLGESSISVTTLTVQNVDPTATDDSLSLNADAGTITTTNVLGNDTDPVDSLSVTSVSSAPGLTVSNNGDGTFDVTVGSEFASLRTGLTELREFTYTITDGDGGSDTGTVTVTVNGTNDLPTPDPDYAVTTENTSVVIDLLDNDSDPEGETLFVVDVETPADGSIINHGDGTITYTPDTNFDGTDTFNYRVIDDSQGYTNYWGFDGDATDSLTGVNGTIFGATLQQGSVGTGLSFAGASDHVQISDFSYANEFTVSLDFKIDDITGSNTQILYSHGNIDTNNSLNILIRESSNVWKPGHIAISFWDFDDTITGNDLEYDLVSNGLVGDGNWHNVTLVVDSTHATMYVDGDQEAQIVNRGGETFNPNGDLFLGALNNLSSTAMYDGQIDSVRVLDRPLSSSEVATMSIGGDLVTEQITVTVTDNGQPTAVATVPTSINEGEGLTINGSLSSDPENDLLTYEWDIDFDGSFDVDLTTETANLTWADLNSFGITDDGSYRIALQVSDGISLDMDEATLIVQNVDPTFSHDINDQLVNEDDAFSFQFAANSFYDPVDEMTYTARLVDGSADGAPLPSWLNFDPNTRTFSGTPTNAEVGAITIRVTASDGATGGTPATDDFILTVVNTNDAPTVANPIGNLTASEDTPFSYTIPANTFEDVDGETPSINVHLSGGGSLPDWLIFDSATNTLSGTPLEPDSGTLVLDVVATDGSMVSATDTVTLTVNAVNDAPVVESLSTETLANEPVSLSSGEFYDLISDPDSVVFTPVLGASVGGTAEVLPDGSIQFTPNEGFFGTAFFVVQADDGMDLSNIAVVRIEVIPPIIANPSDSSDDSTSDSDSDNSSESSESEDVSTVAGGPGDTTQDEDDEKIVGAIRSIAEESRSSAASKDLSGTTVRLELKAQQSQFSFTGFSQLRSMESQLTDGQERVSEAEPSANVTNPQLNYSFMASDNTMWKELEQTQNEFAEQMKSDTMLVGTVGAATSSLTACFIAYALRGGFLLSGLLTHVPVWKAVDPIMIMQGFGGEGESLQEIMEEQRQSLDGV